MGASAKRWKDLDGLTARLCGFLERRGRLGFATILYMPRRRSRQENGTCTPISNRRRWWTSAHASVDEGSGS